MPESQKGIAPLTFEGDRSVGINHLLAIAIDEYVPRSPEYSPFPNLYNCVKDAKDFKKLLVKHYLFEDPHIILLLNHDATLRAIINAFEKLIDRVGSRDNLVIFFSGHGVYDRRTDEGFWVPIDARKGESETFLSNDRILKFISGINSHHTFLISDSCFSGSLFLDGATKSLLESEQYPSRWGLTSGRIEVVSDGKPGLNSPFAEALLKRLNRAEDAIGVLDLCSYVVNQVKSRYDQSPIGAPLKNVKGQEFGQFIFRKKQVGVDEPLTEEEIWQLAKSTMQFSYFQQYIEKFPFGSHRDEVWKILNKVVSFSNGRRKRTEGFKNRIKRRLDSV